MTSWQKNAYEISSDPTRLQLNTIVRWLQASCWASGRSHETIERSLQHSLNFGMYHQGKQVGFARVVTDHATFAYLCDVVIEPAHRGLGLGKWLMDVIVFQSGLQNLRRFMLATRDAHGLYAQFGFAPLSKPERFMERFHPEPDGSVPESQNP